MMAGQSFIGRDGGLFGAWEDIRGGRSRAISPARFLAELRAALG